LKKIFSGDEAACGKSPQNGEISISRIKSISEKYYGDGDYFCSEAIVKTIRDEFNLDIGDEAIAMSSGFPVGIGGSECMCGAVAGGCMCIGMVFGRTRARDKSVAKTMELSKELHDRFKQRNKVLCCRILTKGMKKGSKEHRDQCSRFTGEVAADTARIMAREMKLTVVS
jgi:C_GCAxxG_C_C family probable redox protein